MRYLRQLLEAQKGYDMSKAIWNLSDMDISFSGYYRYAINHLSQPADLRIMCAFAAFWILRDVYDEFWVATEKSDTNLMIIIDMIKNADRWQTLINHHPKSLFSASSAGKVKVHDKSFVIKPDIFEHFQAVYNTMEQLLQEARDTPKPSCKYYILRYRLHSHPDGKEICEQVLPRLDDCLTWNRNSGLMLTVDNDKKIAIENMSENDLYDQLTRLLTPQRSISIMM